MYMKQNQDIEKKVEETLNSLDGIGRANANPFLFTRVEAKLRQPTRNVWEQVTGYISRPAIALAMLGMVIFSNAAVMFWNSAPEEAVSSDQPQLALSDEYNLNVSSFYEDENPEP
jgi:hypothetical protein